MSIIIYQFHECYEIIRQDMLWNVTLAKLFHIRHNMIVLQQSSWLCLLAWRFPSLLFIQTQSIEGTRFFWWISQRVATMCWPRRAADRQHNYCLHGWCKMKESLSSLKICNSDSAKTVKFYNLLHNFSYVLLMWKLHRLIYHYPTGPFRCAPARPFQ